MELPSPAGLGCDVLALRDRGKCNNASSDGLPPDSLANACLPDENFATIPTLTLSGWDVNVGI
jgi:hypothetical protein